MKAKSYWTGILESWLHSLLHIRYLKLTTSLLAVFVHSSETPLFIGSSVLLFLVASCLIL